MTIAIGGDGSGLQDTSLTILKRGDPIRSGETGHGEQLYVNTSNGNLVVQHEDGQLEALPAEDAAAFVAALPKERRALYEEVDD